MRLFWLFLQIRLSNVHIRYEDSTTHPGQPFAFGFTLQRLAAEVIVVFNSILFKITSWPRAKLCISLHRYHTNLKPNYIEKYIKLITLLHWKVQINKTYPWKIIPPQQTRHTTHTLTLAHCIQIHSTHT